MGWAGNVAHMGERIGVCRLWWGNLMERDHLEDQGIDGRIILRCILREWDGGRWRALVNAVMDLGLHKMRGIS